jgi:asparagine synthase (glutamine-hydrolysing)
MCGIAGYVSREPFQQPQSVLSRMTAVIRHRGPDDHGDYRDSFAALGHRRLSIIDLSGGRQPMFNEDGTLCIVYNGEIFNHAALRPELERAGHRYRTRSDTETILHGYEELGPAVLSRLRGMFAFAIWDAPRRTLFCARDRLGKKPFYYYWDGRVFVFGSEIKALLEHPAISPAFDETCLSEYLHFGYTSGEETLFRGIRKLMPGHYLLLDPEHFEVRPYWDVPAPTAPPDASDEPAWIARCRAHLEDAVRTRLMSDVPVGVFLSGGVDSSAVAALVRRMAEGGPVKTFAVGYGESAYSELGYARQVAAHLGTEHQEVVVGMEDFLNAVPRLVWHEDEPLAWPSSVALYFVTKLASREVKVVLTGEGSDELFAGYARYRFYLANQRWMPFYGMLPLSLREAVRHLIASSPLLSGSLRRKLQHSLLGRGESVENLLLDNFYSAFPCDEQSALLRSSAAVAPPCRTFLRYWDSAGGRSLLGRMLYTDQKTYLVELLMKQDQMSMAASIESRVPFLDHLLVEFAASVPDKLKLRGGEGKYILKRAVEDLLPRDIVYRRKMGFPTPLACWLRDTRADAVYSFLRRRDGLLAAYIDSAALDDLLVRHRAGSIDATDRIWRLLTLQIWGDLFLTGRRADVWDGLMTRAAASLA